MIQITDDADTAIQLPRGPKGSWLPTLSLIRNPRQAMEGWVKTYGDPFLLNALNGPVVVTGREDLIRTIHGQDPDLYSPFAGPTIVPLMGGGSMLILEGDLHRQERRLITPMFHGDRMKAYGSTMKSITVNRYSNYRAGDIVPTLDAMTDISLEVITRTIFGGDDEQLVKRLMNASQRTVQAAHPLLFFSAKTHRRFFGWSPWDRWTVARNDLVNALDDAIEMRRGDEQRDDILSMLCNAKYEDGQNMTREHIHAELITFLFAGHETTALALTWAMYHLHTHPSELAKLRQELSQIDLDNPSAVAGSPYLKAVIQETLRLHPIITETLRKLKRPFELGGFRLPTGMGLAPATVLAHYNPATYPDPDLFRPERFIERSYSPFQFMPFGGGHRRCIGAAFASYEMAMVIAALIARYTFEIVDAKPVVPKRRNVTIGPSSKVPLKIITVKS